GQLALRARKVSELEQALEAAGQNKARAEKELQAKIAAAEGKAQEASMKLAQAAKEKKDLEARHLKELEDQVQKQKAEIERREAIKQQEVTRLQAAVQEKSKALKVGELELARYKNKPAGPAAKPGTSAGAPAVTAAKPQQSIGAALMGLGEGDEGATMVTTIPVDQKTVSAAVPQKPAASPARPA